MRKKLISILISIILILSLTGCGGYENGHKHSWVPPTCTEPIVCTECGATKGEALGHTFVSATCVAPSTCARCGETQGEPIGHMYTKPTYTEPSTCLVCGFESDIFLTPNIVEIGKFEALYEASEEYLIYREKDYYGVVNCQGEKLTEPVYDGFVTGLENNSFAMYYLDGETCIYDLYSSLGKVIFNTGTQYQDYRIVGMSGGFLTLNNDKDNTWYYLEADESFAPKAYIDAYKQDKETLSLVSNSYIVTRNSKGIGYPFISLENMSYFNGFIQDTVLIDAAGSEVSQSGEVLVSEWAETTMGDYAYIATGLYNVFTNTFEEIKGFYDDNCLLMNIISYDGSGINEVPYKDGIMLLQSGTGKDGEIYDIYSLHESEFVTDYGVEQLIISQYAPIAKVSGSYYYLSDTYEPASGAYDNLTLFSEDGLSLGLRDGKAYVLNNRFCEITEGIEAASVSHRFKDYYIIGVEDGDILCRIE